MYRCSLKNWIPFYNYVSYVSFNSIHYYVTHVYTNHVAMTEYSTVAVFAVLFGPNEGTPDPLLPPFFSQRKLLTHVLGRTSNMFAVLLRNVYVCACSPALCSEGGCVELVLFAFWRGYFIGPGLANGSRLQVFRQTS